MIIIEPWDCDPDALDLDVAVCVVCGNYCTSKDQSMLGAIMWFVPEDRWSSTMSPTIAYHTGEHRCIDVLDMAVEEDGGRLLDWEIGKRLDFLRNNVREAPKVGNDGLLRCRRKPIDLVRTNRILQRINSPLVDGVV